MSMSLAEAKEKLDRAYARAKNITAKSEEMATRGLDYALTYGGNAAAGFMRGKWGEGADRHVYIPGTEIEVDALIGTAGTALAVLGVFGSVSSHVGAFAAGLGGYAFGRTLEEKIAHK